MILHLALLLLLPFCPTLPLSGDPAPLRCEKRASLPPNDRGRADHHHILWNLLVPPSFASFVSRKASWTWPLFFLEQSQRIPPGASRPPPIHPPFLSMPINRARRAEKSKKEEMMFDKIARHHFPPCHIPPSLHSALPPLAQPTPALWRLTSPSRCAS